MGPASGAFAGSHYDSSQLEALGANLALALLDYSDPALLAKAAAELTARQQAPRKAPLGRPQEAGISSSSSLAGSEVRTVSNSCWVLEGLVPRRAWGFSHPEKALYLCFFRFLLFLFQQLCLLLSLSAIHLYTSLLSVYHTLASSRACQTASSKVKVVHCQAQQQ